MAIYDLDLSTLQQKFKVSNEDKLEYGEIYTPFSLINKMLDLFEPAVFTKADKRWLDIGAGQGYFTIVLFDRLNKGLATINEWSDERARKQHIVKNMLYMAELKESNIIALREMFGSNANILSGDFSAMEEDTKNGGGGGGG